MNKITKKKIILQNTINKIQKERSIPSTRGNIYDRNGKLYNYYMEPYSTHYVSSVERFEKYLIEGIKYQIETYNRMVTLNNAL
mgnify:CR=1 FL=1